MASKTLVPRVINGTVISRVDYDLNIEYGEEYIVLPPRGVINDLDLAKIDEAKLKGLVQIRRG